MSRARQLLSERYVKINHSSDENQTCIYECMITEIHSYMTLGHTYYPGIIMAIHKGNILHKQHHITFPVSCVLNHDPVACFHHRLPQ